MRRFDANIVMAMARFAQPVMIMVDHGHDVSFFGRHEDRHMAMDYEELQLAQIRVASLRATRVAESSHGTVRRAVDLLQREIPLSERITRRSDDYYHRIDDRQIDHRLVAKIARAVEERRISEGTIESIIAGCQSPTVRKRGPFFVVAVKRAFDAIQLPWFEEEWA